MDPLTLSLIMAGTGMAKGELIDRPEAEKKMKMEAIKSMYSPWTGQQGDIAGVKSPDTLNQGLQWGMSGYGLGQNIENRDFQKEIMNRMYPDKFIGPKQSSMYW